MESNSSSVCRLLPRFELRFLRYHYHFQITQAGYEAWTKKIIIAEGCMRMRKNITLAILAVHIRVIRVIRGISLPL